MRPELIVELPNFEWLRSQLTDAEYAGYLKGCLFELAYSADRGNWASKKLLDAYIEEYWNNEYERGERDDADT